MDDWVNFCKLFGNGERPIFEEVSERLKLLAYHCIGRGVGTSSDGQAATSITALTVFTPPSRLSHCESYSMT